MTKEIIKKILYNFGYEIKKIILVKRTNGFQQYHYEKPNGTLDYEMYQNI